MAPSVANKAWPPAGVNGVVNSSELRIHFFLAVLLLNSRVRFLKPHFHLLWPYLYLDMILSLFV